MHQPTDADDAAGHMSAVVGDDVLDDVLLHLLLHVVVVNHSEGERQQIGRHGVVAIEGAVGVEDMAGHGGRSAFHGQELLVEGILGQCGFVREMLGISRESLHPGEISHHQVYLIIICGGDERAVGDAGGVLAVDEFLLFGGHTPVGVFVAGHQSILLVLVFQVFQPSFHVGIELAHGLVVAVLANHHVEGHRQGGGPCHVVGIVVPESGSHIGDASVFALCLGDVACPFGVECVVVEKESLAVAAAGAVAEPWLTLIALRTVNGQSFIIGQHAPVGVMEHFLQDGVGGLEGACGGNGIGYDFCDEIA